MKKIKQILALCLAFVLCIGCLPMTAKAATPIDEMQGIQLYYPNYIADSDCRYFWASQTDPDKHQINLGESGVVQDINTHGVTCRCGAILTEELPDLIAIRSFSFSEPGVLKDVKPVLAAYKKEEVGDDYLVGYPCVNIQYTGAKAGTTTVTYDEYLYFSMAGASGYCDNCWNEVSYGSYIGWVKVTKTFQVTVTDPTPDYFTIHFSNGDTKEVTMDGSETYDLTSYVPDGYLYAGTYDAAFETPDDTEVGMEVMPEVGSDYYVKVIPADYIRPKTVSTYSGSGDSRVMKRAFMVTAIDDMDYLKVGFDIDGDAESWDNENENIVYDNLTVRYPGKEDTVYTAESIFKVPGYLGIYEIPADYWDTGAFEVRPYFVTLDGVKVCGDTIRTATAVTGASKVETSDELVGTEYVNVVGSDPGAITSIEPMKYMATFMAAEAEEEKGITVTVVDGSESTQVQCEPGDLRDQITYTEKEGCLFAGWFTDSSYSTAADLTAVETDTVLYAKYVTNDYLQSKVQQTRTRGVVTKVRCISAAEQNQYSEVGNIYTVNGTETKAAAAKLNVRVSGSNAKSLFSNMSSAARLFYTDLNTKGFEDGTEITITPYWITKDGTEVTGTPRTIIYHTDNIEG